MHKAVIVISIFFVISVSWGFPVGAPEESCGDMFPQHAVPAQTSPFPYNVEVSSDKIGAGQEIDIIISGNAFKGFLLQVRDAEDKPVGTFIPTTGTQTLDCGTPKSAVTHTNHLDKTNIILKWKAPVLAGIYKVYVTVVESRSIFWAKIPKNEIIVY